MKIARQTSNSMPSNSRSVVTIGNFDGLHKGHQQMLELAQKKAKQLNATLVVLTFDPLPVEYYITDRVPARLMSFAEKCLGLRQLGVDVVCVKAFDSAFANTDADEFVQQVLVNDLKVAHIVVGDDFRYGKCREGSIDSLTASAEKQGFTISQLDTISQSAERISSTRVRTLLSLGDFEGATALLGRPYSIYGRITRGDQRGRTWGFPTLNLVMKNKRAVQGVYAVKVLGLEDQKVYGVANIGVRPTVGGLMHLLEVHLFDFAREVYGERICVEFHKKIRDEQKFDSFDALKSQIGEDCKSADKYFNENEKAELC